MNPKKFILDSYAVLALLADEPGAPVVADLILDEAAELYLSIINFGEVYYIVWRRHGENAAAAVVQGVKQEERLVVAEAAWPRVKAAARLKAAGGLACADAFALGLARELAAPLVTGDPEIRAAAAGLDVDLIWIGP